VKEGWLQPTTLLKAAMMRTTLALLLTLALAPTALAHGNLSDRIAILGDQIKSHPQVAALYAERADLLAQDGAYADALADWDAAEKLDAKLAPVPCVKAQLFLDLKMPAKAVAILAPLVKANPKHGPAWFLLGQAQVQTGDAAGACASFDAAIPLLSPLLPEHVLAQAEAQVSVKQGDEAIKRLEAGMKMLGPLIVLQDKAVGIEVALGRTQAAVARLEAVIADLKGRKLRAEAWEKRKMELGKQGKSVQ